MEVGTMNTTTLERPQSFGKSVEEAKALLVKRFMDKIDRTSDALIIDAIKLEGDKALVEIVRQPETATENKLSIRARNEIAFAKLKANAFEIVKKSYDFIESSDVCEILNISKQALSKKIKAGQVIAYTNNRRKYYPDFQFKNNKVKPEIGLLTKALNIDPADEPMVNVLIGFLAQPMDFYGGSEKEQPRYKLIDNEDAFKIIVRDFHNRLEMGK
jgi:hypothetical protein